MKRQKTYGEKPYNRCLHCEHRGSRCDGPRTSAMPTERWREYMRDLKAIRNLTNDEISELTGGVLPSRTIQGCLSASSTADVQRETARMIEDALMGSSNQYPCYLAFLEELPDSSKDVMAYEKEILRLQQSIANIHDSYTAELATLRVERKQMIDFLREEIAKRDRIIESKDRLIEKLADR